MATYAIGDIQGCFKPLQCLLEQVRFDPDRDVLWVVGDMVNRGPESLATLRYLYGIRQSVVAVLGNHDLHLLAIAAGVRRPRPKDTLDEILSAPDRKPLLDWLLGLPLLHVDRELGYLMCHAGIAPQWTLEQAQRYASEVHNALAEPASRALFFEHMYGDEPELWTEDLRPPERWRAITNYFTRMRFCDQGGRLELTCKLGPEQAPDGYQPWFLIENKLQLSEARKLLFGHWASLEGRTDVPHMVALDTGCVWGRRLTLLHLETGTFYNCNCQ